MRLGEKLARNCLKPPTGAKFDVVVGVATGSLGSRSVTDLLATLQELEHLGVGFVSLNEALDLTTPAGRAMAGLLAIFAEFEREILRERTRAGLAHARQNGKRLGRPVTAGLHATEVWKRASGWDQQIRKSLRTSANRTHVRAPDSELTYFPEKIVSLWFCQRHLPKMVCDAAT